MVSYGPNSGGYIKVTWDDTGHESDTIKASKVPIVLLSGINNVAIRQSPSPSWRVHTGVAPKHDQARPSPFQTKPGFRARGSCSHFAVFRPSYADPNGSFWGRFAQSFR